MAQISFRVDDDTKSIIEFISKIKGISPAELAKRATLKEISNIRVEVAFTLLEEGKIGRKRAWTISGLSPHEFLVEWTNWGAKENISDKIIEKELNLIDIIDLSQFKK